MTTRERAALAQREAAIGRLCERLGVPRDLPRLNQALTHPSFSNERRRGFGEDYQRLEFLGDAALGLCVSELLMAEFEDVDEGELTVMRASLVNTEALAEFAREVDLAEALLLGRGADVAGERHRTNVLADGVEAIVGAVYLAEGLERARELTHIVVARRLEGLIASGGVERDAKSRLQEWAQARGLPPPRYRVVDTQGPAHSKTFVVEVAIHESDDRWKVLGAADGRTKKNAERRAARLALSRVEQDQ
ncbi:MAG: ribonuclease III [Deltaproteobacteria bacterium]|jgi:ribonuclease-3|nr:ribonuclease III [Deltaproteobacteria bacterium]MBW2531504.1 ribonuclease III [Deltaproteobacteria bacterium]